MTVREILRMGDARLLETAARVEAFDTAALHALIDAAGYFRRYDVSINGKQLNWWAAREIVRPSKDKITTTTAPTRGEQQP